MKGEKAYKKNEQLKILLGINENFEKAQNDLNQYMEDKRYAFPRFYFISDDELLKILSTATEIKQTEKNLSKVFEFINKLDYMP